MAILLNGRDGSFAQLKKLMISMNLMPTSQNLFPISHLLSLRLIPSLFLLQRLFSDILLTFYFLF